MSEEECLASLEKLNLDQTSQTVRAMLTCRVWTIGLLGQAVLVRAQVTTLPAPKRPSYSI